MAPECTIIYVGAMQRLAGRGEEILMMAEDATLGALLRELSCRHGPALTECLLEDDKLAPHAGILINGRNAHGLGGLEAKLDENSAVEILILGPPLAGG